MMAIVPVGARRRVLSTNLRQWTHPVRQALGARPALLLTPLLALLLLATLAGPDREGDEAGYLELARNLLDGHYASGRPDALLDADPSYPDLWFGPGLPLVLAVPVALDVPVSILRLTGPVFLFLALVVFFALTRRYVMTRAALVATWALGLYLPFYTVLPNLHSEPLAILLVVVASYAIARSLEEGAATWLILGAVALAGVALTRVAYGWVLTIVFVVLVAWWVTARSAAPRRLAAMFALALGLCLPWLAYTAHETGRLFQWGNSGSLSLYWMSSPYDGDLGDWQQAHLVFVDDELAAHRPFFEGLRGLPLPEQNERLERRALASIRDHPGEYLRNLAANASRMLFDTPYSRSPQRLSALFFAVPNALLLGLTLLAAIVAVRVRGALPPPALPFALLAGVALLLHLLVATYPRMLLPVVPLLAWLCATTVANHVRVVPPAAQGAG